MNYFDLFDKYLQRVKKGSEDNYTALCPFHDDHHPSFSFNASTGLWQCFACGEKGNAYQFADRMGDEEWKKRIPRELRKEQKNKVENWKKDALEKSRRNSPELKTSQKQKTIVNSIVYHYYDRAGKHVYDKIRYEYDDNSKKFSIDWKSDDRRQLLYDLLSLTVLSPNDISEVWFCEGEKCRDALLEATDSRLDILILSYSSSPEQELKNSQIDDWLLGKKIVIFEDNDETGQRKAQSIANYVKKYASQIDLVSFQDKEKGYDIADFLEEGHSIEEAFLFSKTIYQKIVITNVNEYKVKQLPPVEKIDELYNIPKGVLGLVAGMGSVGKGFFLMWNMLRWIEKYSVVYLSLEDPLHILEHRLQRLVRKRVKRVNKEEPVNQTKPFMLDTFESLFELSITSLFGLIQEYVNFGYEIIIVDPISALLEDEKDNSEVSKMMFELNKLCATHNVNIFLSHHVRKRQKGEVIKTKYDMLDLIRGASALHSNARFIWFLRRSQAIPLAIEIWNVKNSYLPNTRDFMIEMFTEDIPRMSQIWLSESKGDVFSNDLIYFYEFEKGPIYDFCSPPERAKKFVNEYEDRKENKRKAKAEKHNNISACIDIAL